MSIRRFPLLLTVDLFRCRKFLQVGLFLLAALFFTLFPIESSIAQTQSESTIRPELVSDINSDTPGSNPSSLVVMGDMMYFSATDGEHNRALWKSDGTEGGTQLVKELYPNDQNSGIRDIVTVNETLILAAMSTNSLHQIWFSDGTEAGTIAIDIEELTDTYWHKFLVVDSIVYFTAERDSEIALWRTDGTVSGTIQLLSLNTESTETNEIRPYIYLGQGDQIDGKLYFFVTEYETSVDAVTSSVIWESNGTASGTRPVVTVNASESGWAITAGADTFYFVTFDIEANSANIWKSDGTESNTEMVKEITPNFPLRPTSWEDIVWNDIFYVGIRQDDLHQGEFWKSNGTADGTVKIADICGQGFFPFAGELFFAGDICDGIYRGAPTLWKTNGSDTGTLEVIDVTIDSRIATPNRFRVMGEHLYFAGYSDEMGGGLWQSDGTAAGTKQVSEVKIRPYQRAITSGDLLFFAADESSSGSELYVSDGTSEGTQLVRNIYDNRTFSSFPEDITAFGMQVCMRAKDTIGSTRIYCSDESLGQFQPVSDVIGWDMYEDSLAGTDNLFYYSVDNQLWRTDGTESGTMQVYSPSGGSNLLNLTSAGSEVFFSSASGVWTSDGTDDGTQLIHPNIDGRNIKLSLFTWFNGNMLFARERWGESYMSEEYGLMMSNGTSDGLTKIVPLKIQNLVAGSAMLYFSTIDELWKSDGTPEGTIKLHDFATSFEGNSQIGSNWIVDDDTLYFSAGDEVHGVELWKSDGTSEGTGLVADVVPGPDSSNPRLLAVTQGTIYFAARNQGAGWDLWNSDGTAGGTNFVKTFSNEQRLSGHEFNPATLPSVGWNGRLVMMLQNSNGEPDPYGDGELQSELWISEGTEASTRMLVVASPTTCTKFDSYRGPCSLMKHPALNQVFFTAFDDTHGYELWTLVDDASEPATPTPDPTNTPTPMPPDTPTPTPSTTPEPTPTPIMETPEPTPGTIVLPPTATPTSTPTSTPAPEPVDCGPLEQEAESGLLAGKWSIGDDVNASDGQYIFVPDTDEAGAANLNPTKASYCFTVTEAGTYRLLGWVYAEDGRDNSVFISLDGQPTDGYIWELPVNTSYAADYANSRGGDDPIEIGLEPGKYTVTLSLREDGVRVDKLALVLVDGTQPILAPPMPATCTAMGSEAEDGTLYGNFEVGSDENASGGQYVSLPDPQLRSGTAATINSSINNLNLNHRVDYCIIVAEAGEFRLRTQVLAPDYRANSFFVQIDGAPETAHLYDIYPIGETYLTDYVSARGGADPVIYPLEAGQHVVSFILREDGTRLDSFTFEPTSVKATSNVAPTLLEIEENLQAEEGSTEIKLYLPLLQ